MQQDDTLRGMGAETATYTKCTCQCCVCVILETACVKQQKPSAWGKANFRHSDLDHWEIVMLKALRSQSKTFVVAGSSMLRALQILNASAAVALACQSESSPCSKGTVPSISM